MAQAVAPRDSAQVARAVTAARPAWMRTMLDVLRTYPYLIPAIIFFVGWQVLPIYSALRLSFTDDKFLDQVSPNWVGLENYRALIRDTLFWKGVLRAFTFTSIFVPGMILIPMVVAVLIDRVTSNRIATTYRLILLIPSMMPAPLIFVLWSWMYNNYIGPINWLLVDVLHIYNLETQPQWINDTRLVFFSLAFMEWWWGLGYHTMFFLAGLATIPKDLFDAARVDGASEWRIFWGVTVWRLLPIILVLAVVRFGSAMAVIDEYLIMGGMNRTRNTYTWTVYMYETAFSGGLQFRGYAAAIGWLGAVFMLFVVIGMFYIFRSRD
ncbi:MAG: multiple sugar transport system permease protein [Thermomicrobiales bacterium]|jgi:ABC-type sugar transport system permease subunit|nr:multiple sugar transport system permease protein [Thermomicrobiales bacterium]